MLIKNISEKPVTIAMKTRTLHIEPGEEVLVSAEEVMDPTLRDYLQVRAVAVVRPATEEEEAELSGGK